MIINDCIWIYVCKYIQYISIYSIIYSTHIEWIVYQHQRHWQQLSFKHKHICLCLLLRQSVEICPLNHGHVPAVTCPLYFWQFGSFREQLVKQWDHDWEKKQVCIITIIINAKGTENNMLDQTVDNNQLPLRTYENDVFTWTTVCTTRHPYATMTRGSAPFLKSTRIEQQWRHQKRSRKDCCPT